MFILMTTANFPDIMLPAYNRNRIWCIFFIIYVLLQVYLLMSLMLAIFYSNFNKRFEAKLGKNEQNRNEYLTDLYMKAGGTKGYLTKDETYKLFVSIHKLVIKSKELK